MKAPDNNASVGCPHCASSQTFTSRQYLNNHIIYKHPGKNTVKQDDKEFRAVIHNEQGSGEKNDQLSDCGLNQIESTAKNDELKDNESEKQLRNRKRRSYILYFLNLKY